MNKALQWRAIGRSVRGASHVRSGLPNQDAIHWLPASGVGPPLILAVSDGHGSPKSFRSNIGSGLAVEETAWLIQDLLDGQPDPNNLSAIKRTAEERLPQEIARRWQEAMDKHLKKTPFTTEEFEALEKKQGADARHQVEDNPRLAYGATILCVLVTSGFILYLQLGDGDILTVLEDGTVLRPLPGDERLFANETTSLCMSEAWREIRFRFQATYGPPPALILLSSDGYANSFVNDAAFLKVGSDILDIIRADGPKVVEDNLGAWLKDASEAGSGDDITMGILFRTDILAASKTGRRAESKQPETSTQDEAPAGSASTALQEAPPPVVDKTQGEAQTSEAAPAELPVGPTSAPRVIRRIKNEAGPREPSKKLPDLFVDD